MKKYDAAIIGGGMSGMVAAVLLADHGKSVCILERQERLGKKILLTGNGKCNLTNKFVSNVDYICDDVDKLDKILGNVDYEKEMKFWGDLGLYLKEKNGSVYPVSNQAATVSDILKLALNKIKQILDSHRILNLISLERNIILIIDHCEERKTSE